MKLETIAEHTIAPDLLTGGFVLDAGCLGFEFGLEFCRRGHPVVFVDPAPDIEPPASLFDLPKWANFVRGAVVGEGYPSKMPLRMTADKQARHLTNAAKEGDPMVTTTTLHNLMREMNVEQWDVLKLDIEGAEHDVLMSIEGPIARQLTVEWHEHCAPKGDAAIQAVVDHLSRWYVPVQHAKDKRHCLPENWWDSLFVLRDLV